MRLKWKNEDRNYFVRSIKGFQIEFVYVYVYTNYTEWPFIRKTLIENNLKKNSTFFLILL